MRAIRLEKRYFRMWLSGKTRKNVGDPNNQHDCALCRYLKFRGAKKVEMHHSYRIVDGTQTRNTAWAVQFQREAIAISKNIHKRGVELRGGEILGCLR